jgi:NADH:ubiquinone oxidoreductase subunit K
MLMSVHVLGHVAALPRVAVAEYASPARGRGWRGFAVTLALAAGVTVAVALLPHFHAWQAAHVFHHRR